MAYVPPSQRRRMAEGEQPPPVSNDEPRSSGKGGGKGPSKGNFRGEDAGENGSFGGGYGGGKGAGKGWRGGKKGGMENEGQERTTWGNRGTDESSLEELFQNTRHATGSNFEKSEPIEVEITGAEITPLEDFEDCELAEALLLNINRSKYRKPTPVQRNTIPIMLGGYDLMACAQTGSGKTAAFLFPIIHTLLDVGPRPYRSKIARHQVAPEALVLAPTRELAVQIHTEAKKFSYRSDLRCVAIYGGMDMRVQAQDLDDGCQILVATPGRLLDFCTARDRTGKGGKNGPSPKVSLTNIWHFCIDEADRMLDLGFELQINQITSQRGMPPAAHRQTVMFSATFPESIQKLSREFLKEQYCFVKVGKVGSTNAGITQTLEFCADSKKRDFLLLLMKHAGAYHAKRLALIFVDTKRDANDLVGFLVNGGFEATSIHGDRSQEERLAALKSFKSGVTPVLVATDVASRGLDIPNVSHVVQYDLAHNLDDYVHRIGRTGRAGNTGTATAFYNQKNRSVAKALLGYLSQHGQDIPQGLVDIASQASTLPSRSNGKSATTTTTRASARRGLSGDPSPPPQTYTAGNMCVIYSLLFLFPNFF